MNIQHNHEKATSSEKADNLEKDIESIQQNIANLTHELLNRVKSSVKPQELIKRHKILFTLILFLLLNQLLPRKRKKFWIRTEQGRVAYLLM